MGKVSETLEEVHKSQEQHSRILIRVARNHGNLQDVEDLTK